MATPPDSVADNVQRLRKMFARGSSGQGLAAAESAGGLESMGFEPTEPLPSPDGPEVTRRVDQTRAELNRIVRDYLGDAKHLHDLADEIARRGDRALQFLRTGDDAEFERHPEALGDLEAIVRTDGSRPTFLIRDGVVDRDSSPVGTWGTDLDADAVNLEKAITCVGRIDDPHPSLQPGGYGGTGFLVHDNLIVTNRHVLQLIAEQQADKSWTLHPNTAIDFGHEFRGRASVGQRKLRRVVFVGPKPINLWFIDHTKLDLAVIELEPAADDARPLYRLSVDAATDWAGAGGPNVYTIGYPYKPQQGVYPATLLEQLFQQTYGHKRLAPGNTIPPQRTSEPWTVAHDGTTLGGNSGSVVVVSGRPIIAAGLHYGGLPVQPAENWGHILGHVLSAKGEGGRTLGEVLDEYKVVLSNRAVAGPAGGAGGS